MKYQWYRTTGNKLHAHILSLHTHHLALFPGLANFELQVTNAQGLKTRLHTTMIVVFALVPKYTITMVTYK